MSLTLNPQSSWTPEACLVVYTTLGDGTVVNDVTTLSVHPNFENKVNFFSVVSHHVYHLLFIITLRSIHRQHVFCNVESSK